MKLRKKMIEVGFTFTSNLYRYLYKKNKPWNISSSELISYPNYSFGFHLGVFLKENNFELIPKSERHDCFHTLLGYNTQVEGEIALQCARFGNGCRSIYMFMAVIVGFVLLPEYYDYYMESYLLGKKSLKFHHLKFKDRLYEPIEGFRKSIFSNVNFISVLNS